MVAFVIYALLPAPQRQLFPAPTARLVTRIKEDLPPRVPVPLGGDSEAVFPQKHVKPDYMQNVFAERAFSATVLSIWVRDRATPFANGMTLWYQNHSNKQKYTDTACPKT